VAELQELARQGDALRAGNAPVPMLRGLASRMSDHEATLDDIHDLIATGADRLDASQRAAALAVFGDHEHRFLHNLMARRTKAGELLGLGESNFRKKREDGTSPYDQLTTALAEAIVAVGRPADEANVTSPRARRRWFGGAAAALALVVAASVAVVTFDSSGGGGDTGAEATDETLEAERSSPPPSMSAAGLAETGRPVAGCNIPVGAVVTSDLATPDIVAAAADAFETAAEVHDLGCPLAVMERWQALWTQEIGTADTASWHIAVEATEPHRAFVFSDLLFRGYFRILDEQDGEGVNAQHEAGLPREVQNRTTGPFMRTSNGSLVIGESDQVMPRWLAPEAVVVWEQLGGAESGLGYPITDLNFVDNAPRQEFEHGYGRAIDGRVEVTVLDAADIAAEVAALPRGTEMILETYDKTSWWIDADGIRHWIASAEDWACLGGYASKVGEYTPGWVVGTFTLGDIAVCD
jgi:hypothetical protein